MESDLIVESVREMKNTRVLQQSIKPRNAPKCVQQKGVADSNQIGVFFILVLSNIVSRLSVLFL